MNPSQVNSRERLFKLQQAVYAEIKSLDECSRVLRLRHNALSPISSLPPELFAAIFSHLFLPGTSSLVGGNLKPDHHLARLRVSHVCHQWREIALHQPLLWSHVDFTKAGATEILVRAKSAPLYLEARISRLHWDDVRYTTFQKELQTRTLYICHLSISAGRVHFQRTLEGLVAPAPTLEYLSLIFRGKDRSGMTWLHLFPDSLFNGSTPRLSHLKLRNVEINWELRLLIGLRYLEIRSPPEVSRPDLATWLDALDEMPYLTTLALHSASPVAPRFPFHVERTATLPSLTHLEILASVRDCALVLAHLDMPALTILCIMASTGLRDDFQMLLPYVVRHAHGPQDTQPLQSVLIRSDRNYTDILAWPVPDIDAEVQDPPTLLAATLPTRLTLSFPNWLGYTYATYITMAIAALPLESVVTFVAQDFKNPLDEASWLFHIVEWPLLRRMRLAAPVEAAFREMLLYHMRLDSSQLPSLRELALVGDMIYHWIHPIKARVEQGVPLELLDLRMHTPITHPAEVEVLSKIGVNVLGPDKTSEERERIRSIWKTLGSGLFARDTDFGARDSGDSDTSDDLDYDPW